MENNLQLKCPECGADIIENLNVFECKNHKYDYKNKVATGCNFVIFKQLLNKKISVKTLEKLLAGEIINVENFKNSKGKSFDAGIKLAKDEDENKYKIQLVFDDAKKNDDDDKDLDEI